MVVIGRALMGEAEANACWTSRAWGLAPLLVQAIFDVIRRINAESGVSMLLVEQNASVALGSASHGFVMETGRIVLDGPAEAVGGKCGHQGVLSWAEPDGRTQELPGREALQAAQTLVGIERQWSVVSGAPAEGWRYFIGDLFEHFEDSFQWWVDGVELEDEVGGVGQDAVGA